MGDGDGCVRGPHVFGKILRLAMRLLSAGAPLSRRFPLLEPEEQARVWNEFCASSEGQGRSRLYEIGIGDLDSLFSDRDALKCLSRDDRDFDRHFNYGDRYYFVDREQKCIRSLPYPMAEGSPVDLDALSKWAQGGPDA